MTSYKIMTTNVDKPVVILHAKEDAIIDGKEEKLTPCGWTSTCPTDTVECEICPAKELHEAMTYEEALEWWRKQ